MVLSLNSLNCLNILQCVALILPHHKHNNLHFHPLSLLVESLGSLHVASLPFLHLLVFLGNS